MVRLVYQCSQFLVQCVIALAVAGAALPGTADSRLGLEIESRYLAHYESAQADELIIQIEPEWELSTPRWSLFALGRLRMTRDEYSPGRPSQATRAGYNRRADLNDYVNAELRELYLDIHLGSTTFRLGKQQVVWGEADGLKVLDTINPADFTEFILEPFEDSRIPTWMVSTTTQIGSTSLEFVLSLDSSAHLFAPASGSFALTSARTRQPDPDLVRVDQQADVLRSPEGGGRLSTTLARTDVSLVVLSRFSDLPAYRLTDSAADPRPLAALFAREELYGLSATRAVGDFVVRGEFAYVTDRQFTRDELTRTEPLGSDVLQGVLGIDWFGPASWFVSGQYFVEDRRREIAAADPRGRDEFATLAVRKRWRNDQLTLSVTTLWNRFDKDWLIRPRLSFEFSDALEAALGADVFHGTRQGAFGQFQDASRMYFSLTWNVSR